MIRNVLVAAVLASVPACGHQAARVTTARVLYLPNATTPGALNPDVTQANLATTVCRPGWSTEQRPSSSVTTMAKRVQLGTSYAYEHLQAVDVEEDHRVPISVGGAPADLKNLWPEPHAVHGPDAQMAGSFEKDGLEWYAYRHLCGKAKPTVPLKTAQSWFLGNWYHWYVKFGRPKAPMFFH